MKTTLMTGSNKVEIIGQERKAKKSKRRKLVVKKRQAPTNHAVLTGDPPFVEIGRKEAQSSKFGTNHMVLTGHPPGLKPRIIKFEIT